MHQSYCCIARIGLARQLDRTGVEALLLRVEMEQ
jgi:hypothetical protein